MRNTILCAFAMLIFAGCGTTVSFQVQRAPEMDTAGIKRIAIMPFESVSNNNLQRTTAQYITATATSKIRAANYFTLVDHREIERLQRNNERIENYVDALFTGQIVSLRTNDSSRIEKRKDPKTEAVVEVVVYEREVELVFSYRLIRARDGSIIDLVTRQGRNGDSNEARDRLKSGSQMLEEIVTSQLSGRAKQVAPYTAVVSRSLMDEKSKDKVLKNGMKDIAALVKSGNYRTALNRYLSIYEQYGNIAAAYNAAIMYEALGDIGSAIDVIENAYNITGNSNSRNYLASLRQNQREQERLSAQFTDVGNQWDRVIAYAVDEVYRVLPQGARLWVVNNSKEEIILADTIADGIISGLIRKGTTVVDRENSALVEAEQLFQMSGSVSDNDFVSIGNAVGANTLAIVAVSGVGSLRRLQLRVLDIETRTSLYQSGASDNWKL
jgi:TolB-like protein